MTHMIVRFLGRHTEEERSPYVDMEGFDPHIVREMENEYIRLGYMEEKDKMPIPHDIEFPRGTGPTTLREPEK